VEKLIAGIREEVRHRLDPWIISIIVAAILVVIAAS
jgi:hypothetical protein